MANTDTAVSRINIRNAASGIRLLRGCVVRMRASTEDTAAVFRSVAACASVGMAVTGFGVCSVGLGEFLGGSLSGIVRSRSELGTENYANSRSWHGSWRA